MTAGVRRTLGRGIALAGLAVAACVPPPKPPPTTPAEPAAVEVPAPQQAAIPPSVPESSDPPPPPLPDVRAAELVGYDRARLTALLGPPDFARRDAPAELLQYRDATCVLDLFLYPPSDAAPERVTHVEARDRDAGAAKADDCLMAVMRARIGANQ